MNLTERKQLVQWTSRMYQAYALLCDKGDKNPYNDLCKAEAKEARDLISKALWIGRFDMEIVAALADAVPDAYDDFKKFLGRERTMRGQHD